MGTIATVQYQLASVPMIGSSFFVVELNLILRTGTRFITIPFSTVPSPLPSLNKNALSLGLSQASLNILIDVILQMKVKEFMSTPEVFSGAAELTNAIGALLSHQKCPKCPSKSPLKITLRVDGTKRMVLEPNSAILQLSVKIAILAKTSTGIFTSLFVLKANLRLGAQASVHDCKLIFVTKLTSLELVLVSSDVGPIEINSLVTWIELLIVETFVPQVNEYMNVGIPLPSVMNINVGYPVVQTLSGMLVLGV
uniref:BPI fold-containing family B member 3-like n=1 Tax=Pogona vitticeps TaxID=103695 RepID=A0ABM5GDI7_9SAUR